MRMLGIVMTTIGLFFTPLICAGDSVAAVVGVVFVAIAILGIIIIIVVKHPTDEAKHAAKRAAATSAWKYRKNGAECGPVTGKQLIDLAAQGQLKPTDFVWRDGLSAWVSASKVKGLFPEEPEAVLLSVASTPPRPPLSPPPPLPPQKMSPTPPNFTRQPVLGGGPAEGLPRAWPSRLLVAGVLFSLVIVILIVVVAMLPSSHPAAPPAEAQQSSGTVEKPALPAVTYAVSEIIVQPNKDVDERLFLLRALDDLYNQFPSWETDATTLQDELGRLRRLGTKTHLYIKGRNLDASLGDLYADFVSAVDAYADCLASVDKIQRGAIAQAQRNNTETGFDAVLRGTSVASAASDQGYSSGESNGMGVLAGILSAAVDSYQKDKQLQEEKRQAVAQAVGVLKNRLAAFQSQAELTAADLTTKYGWKNSEAGFDDDEENKAIQQLSAAGNKVEAWSLLGKRSERRPRDAFLKSMLYGEWATEWESLGKSKQMLDCSTGCVSCANLVPDGVFFNAYRLRFLHQAGDIANRAFCIDFPNGGIYCGKSNAAAAIAIGIWDACLKDSNDPTGEIREQRAWALGANGDNTGALKQAQDIKALRQKSTRFAYNFACLLSRTGNTDSAFEWLNYAIASLGCNWITRAKVDPDLASVRLARSQEFTELVKVNCSFDVKFHSLANDDILLTNNSKFPITNVVFEAILEQEDKKWTPWLKADVIGAGETHTWPNWVWIPGSRLTKMTATVSCDQNK